MKSMLWALAQVEYGAPPSEGGGIIAALFGGAFFLVFLLVFVIVAAVMVCIDLARKFGKDTVYGVGLAFLPFIFFPMLGFGAAQYDRSA